MVVVFYKLTPRQVVQNLAPVMVLTALELRSAPSSRLYNMLGREVPDDVTPTAAPPRQ